MKINSELRANLSEPLVAECVKDKNHACQKSAQHPESELHRALEQAGKLFDHVISAVTGGAANSQDLQQVKDQIDGKSKDLQSQDKLGNFEIQSLMSDFNEAQTLTSSILKRKDDTANPTIGKI